MVTTVSGWTSLHRPDGNGSTTHTDRKDVRSGRDSYELQVNMMYIQ